MNIVLPRLEYCPISFQDKFQKVELLSKKYTHETSYIFYKLALRIAVYSHQQFVGISRVSLVAQW